jgi:hypothetical protein
MAERVADEVGTALKRELATADVGGANLSTVDQTAHGCIRRVLGRRGLGGYEYKYVWPVLTVEVLPNTPDARKFVFDVRELVSQVEAPWTPDQVESLNAYQHADNVHPFTGERGPNGEETVLVATPQGWVEQEGGPIVQRWAHFWMADWSWRQR